MGERSGRKKSKSWGRWRGLERNRPWEENGGNVKSLEISKRTHLGIPPPKK